MNVRSLWLQFEHLPTTQEDFVGFYKSLITRQSVQALCGKVQIDAGRQFDSDAIEYAGRQVQPAQLYCRLDFIPRVYIAAGRILRKAMHFKSLRSLLQANWQFCQCGGPEVVVITEFAGCRL